MTMTTEEKPKRRGRPKGSKTRQHPESVTMQPCCPNVACKSTQFKVKPGARQEEDPIPLSFMAKGPNGMPIPLNARGFNTDGRALYNWRSMRIAVCDACGQNYKRIEYRYLTEKEYQAALAKKNK